MKTTSFKTTATTFVVGATLLSLGTVSANFGQNISENSRPQLTQEQRESIREAAQSKDFDRVKELLSEYGVERSGRKNFGQSQGKNPQSEDQGRPQMKGGQNRVSPENQEAIEAAIESGNYLAWKELIPEESKIGEVITEENFSLLQELHEARQSGDTDRVQEIREELEFPSKGERGEGGMRNNEEVQAAIVAEDYDAFVEALPEDAPILQKITAENFSKFVELHELQEKAKLLREELGLEGGHGKDPHTRSRGMQRGEKNGQALQN